MEVVLAPCRIPLTCSTLEMQSYRVQLGIDEVETWLYCVCVCVHLCDLFYVWWGEGMCMWVLCFVYMCEWHV